MVHRFALKTDVPRSCHVIDLGKTGRFTLPDGGIVHAIFRQQLSSPDPSAHPSRHSEKVAAGRPAPARIVRVRDDARA
jgi:hypothetical protein